MKTEDMIRRGREVVVEWASGHGSLGERIANFAAAECAVERARAEAAESRVAELQRELRVMRLRAESAEAGWRRATADADAKSPEPKSAATGAAPAKPAPWVPRVGERVRVVTDTTSGKSKKAGDVFVVGAVQKAGDGTVFVTPEPPDGWIYWTHSIEPAGIDTPSPRPLEWPEFWRWMMACAVVESPGGESSANRFAVGSAAGEFLARARREGVAGG